MKRLMVIGCALVSALGGALAASADSNTWWVDDDNYGKAGLDGTSEATAYGTIQDALDNPDFAAGDTVKVLPGVYDKGEWTHTSSGSLSNRVVITKSCTIVSTGGREVTHIVGRHAPTTTGVGESAVRCIFSSTKDALRIEGFTIRDGSVYSSTEDVNGCGGGFKSTSGGRGSVLADCTISNCVARKGAAAQNATFVRCLVKDNKPTGSSSSTGNQVSFYSCIVENCGTASSTCDAIGTTFLCNGSVTAGNGSYYNCLFSGNSGNERIEKANYYCCTLTSSNGVCQVMAPSLGDYRPVASAEAAGTGLAEYYKMLSTVPEVDRYLDYEKNPIPSSGSCDIGAIQGREANPQGGAMISGGDLLIDGRPLPSGRWVYAETYPTQWNVQATVPAGKWLWGFHRGNVKVNRFHPDLNGDAFVMPPPTGVCTTTPVFASYAYWVDPRKDAQGADIGSDDNDGSEDKPFKTLQKAMNVSGNSKYTLIFAAPGHYAEGGRCIATSQTSGFLTNRVCAADNGYYVRLLGAGAGKSFICGAPDPGTGGNGPGAVSPIGLYCEYMTVQGFTLTNGYSCTSTNTRETYGGVFGRSKTGVHILDCEITHCRGKSGVCYQATFTRCHFHDNETAGILVSGSTVVSCLFDHNQPASGDVYQTRAVNCTFRGTDGEALSCDGNAFYASVLDMSTKLCAADVSYGSLFWRIGSNACAMESGTVGNPCFVGLPGVDDRVRACSPAVTCAEAPAADNWGTNYWTNANSDYAGNRLLFPNGRPVAGCYETTVAGAGVYLSNQNGGISGANEGWNALDADDSLTLAMGEGTRPCVGYTLGGVTNLFDETPSRTLTAADVPSGTLVEAIYSNDWYVDANAADDTGWAYTPGSAKKTFAGLFETGLVKSGDLVHAAEGTYDSGVMYRPDSEVDKFGEPYTTGSRVIVPSGVTVVADGRIEETVIKGEKATINPSATYGLGDDAVRCVTLKPNSKIRGFTLADGRTAMKKDLEGWDGEVPKTYYDNLGGAVSGASTSDVGTQVAERCFLKDCAAYRGGGAAYVRLVNCRVTGMYASDTSGNGTSTCRSQHYGTVITGGKGNYAVIYAGSFVFSTLVDSHTHALYRPSSLIGSIVVGSSDLTDGSTLKISNSLLTSMPANATEEKNFTNGTAVVTAAELALDAEGRPTPRTSCALEQGDETLFDTYRTVLGGGETDASGVPRVLNGHLDIGALEADWRATYAQDIGVKRLSVETADRAVVESQDETVLVPEGGTLAGGFRNTTGRAYDFLLRFKVPAHGSLTLTVDGVDAVYAAGTHEVKLTCEGDYLPLAFASAAGTAEILRGQSLMGGLLLVR